MKDRSNHHYAAATAAVCSLATLIVYHWTTRSNKDTLHENQVAVDLLPVEKTLAGGGGGDNAMSTLTWFQGDPTAATRHLKQRALAILQANPWLAGRVRTHNGEYRLIYNSTQTVLDEYFHVLTDTGVTRDVPLSDLGSRLADRLLKTGPQEILWKVSIIVPSSSTAFFAVLMSMSHVIGDGATLYRIQNMLLDQDLPIEALLVDRIKSTEDQQIQVLGGKAEYGFLSSAGFIANCIGGVLQAAIHKQKYKASSRVYLVDQEGMAAAKQNSAAGPDSSSIVPFVSSNDVLTSWFLQNCRCQHGLMALNFRGRLKGHTDFHAGNYENVIFYRQQDSANPALIRQSILQNGTLVFQRAITNQVPMPRFYEVATSSNAICTNWASFAKPANIKGCQEDIQIPLYNVAALLPSTMAICFVFRAGPRGLAVYVAGSQDKLDGLEIAVPFLKKDALVI